MTNEVAFRLVFAGRGRFGYKSGKVIRKTKPNSVRRRKRLRYGEGAIGSTISLRFWLIPFRPKSHLPRFLWQIEAKPDFAYLTRPKFCLGEMSKVIQGIGM